MDLPYNAASQYRERSTPMNFDWATISYPDGRVSRVAPPEFYGIPLGERIELLTKGRIRFEKDNQQISPLDAIRKK
jgi:hypothetical protein